MDWVQTKGRVTDDPEVVGTVLGTLEQERLRSSERLRRSASKSVILIDIDTQHIGCVSPAKRNLDVSGPLGSLNVFNGSEISSWK